MSLVSGAFDENDAKLFRRMNRRSAKMAENMLLHEAAYRGKSYTDKLGGLVVVCGVGALGSNLVDSMCRTGFRKVRIIDADRVERHNLSTQVWSHKDAGAYKVAALQARMFDVARVEVEAHPRKLEKGSIKKLLAKAELVVDCFDNSASRKLVQDWCREQEVPCLHAGLNADYGEVVWDQDYRVPKDVDGDVCDYPLAHDVVKLTVAVAAEEVLNYFLGFRERYQNWTITLKDLQIRKV